MNTNYFHD